MALWDWTWSFSDWILLLLGLGLALYYWGMSSYTRYTKQNLPFSQPLPFIGNMWRAVYKQLCFQYNILDVYNKFKHHPFSILFIFRHPVIIVNDLELIKAVTVKDCDYFIDHRTTAFEYGEPLWRKGLFNLKGQTWKDMRSTLTPAFTSSKMKNMFVLISECCQQFVDFLDQCYQTSPTEDSFITKDGNLLILELKDFYTRYSNDVIATTAFGVEVDSLKQPKNEFFLMGQSATNFGALKLFTFMLFPRLMEMLGYSLVPGKIADFFRSLVKDTISTREREGIVRPDMLQLLMQAKKGTLQDDNCTEQKNSKTQLDDEDIAAQAVVFFMAGFDTTSTLLCFLTHLLAVHPDVQARLQKEIDDTLKEGCGKLTYEALFGMKYLDMVVSETLRLYPPAAALDRLCVQKYTLKTDPPLDLEPGDNIFVPVFGLHRDPQYYPDPDRFDPERFNDENKYKINPMTYLPFGVGPRMCIGNRFALMGAKLAVTHLLARYNVKVVPKTPVDIEIVQAAFNITIRGGFWLGLEQRSV
ncbi:cytochrome P450 9e2-like isoform X2 [Periplaneta americana]|uniref:cytochrome P450 9e2-like isoform X2 n=1 Tax=Periplaneta americana TaxID=6978 RepID=UPI0037E8003F